MIFISPISSRPADPPRCPHCKKVLPQSDFPWLALPALAFGVLLVIYLGVAAGCGSMDDDPYAHPGTSIMARITQAMPTYQLMHWLSEPRP